MNRRMLALIVLSVGIVGTVVAGECSSSRCVTVTHGQTFAVQNHAIIASPLAVTVPVYGAGYNPYASSTDEETKELLKQLLLEMKAMRGDLSNLKANPDGAGEVNANAANAHLKIIERRCAACHTGDAEKGGGFAMMTDDKQHVKPSTNDMRAMLGRLSGKGGNVMPPANSPHGRLTPAEKDVLTKVWAKK